MTRPFDNICPNCGSMMSYIRRRGSSIGRWFCPVCSVLYGPRHEQGEPNPQDQPKDPGGRMGRAA